MRGGGWPALRAAAAACASLFAIRVSSRFSGYHSSTVVAPASLSTSSRLAYSRPTRSLEGRGWGTKKAVAFHPSLCALINLCVQR